MVKKNQLSCSRTKHILPKIFITHGLQKIGEVQGTFSNVQIRGSNFDSLSKTNATKHSQSRQKISPVLPKVVPFDQRDDMATVA
uniref:Uncharacterized protein n=2 Tax=Brassica oleracea TaxID=3712 RepID=A0A0D3CE46_BRAOL|nr:unnamed protein product [Brassica oleracea]